VAIYVVKEALALLSLRRVTHAVATAVNSCLTCAVDTAISILALIARRSVPVALDVVTEAITLFHPRRIAHAVATAVNSGNARAVAATIPDGTPIAQCSRPVARDIASGTNGTRRAVPMTVDVVKEAVTLLHLRRITHAVAAAINSSVAGTVDSTVSARTLIAG
jgi:ribosomal protein L30/L7E